LPSDNHARLTLLGWNEWFADRFAPPNGDAAIPARVVSDHGTAWVVNTGDRELPAALDRRLTAAVRADQGLAPVTGDWVCVRQDAAGTVIETVLERRTAFRRHAAGTETREQVLAANVDLVFVVAALDVDVRPARVERYLAMAWSSGARAAVLLSKADVHPDAEAAARLIERSAGGAPVHCVSGLSEEGVEPIRQLVPCGATAVLLGPSGAGKSTLINQLAGEELMRTMAIRSDGKGRHTTTHRQLVAVPDGGMLIDTPGLRELQLWPGADGLDKLFADIDALAAHCRFSNCGHATEPGCAVRAAVAGGELSEARVHSYRKLRRQSEGARLDVSRRHAQTAALKRRRRIAQMREEELPR
jgi:ribosome biogenesis GTPase